ncbi:MAG: DUF5995 family protein [Candidatus Cyclobacteriaceae bacterium M3_2C_046]
MQSVLARLPYKTIDQVLKELDEIVDHTVRNNNFLGLFAYVYRRTTAEIQKCVEAGQFEDNQRMINFDVAFASLYLDAYYKYIQDQPTSRSWKCAFEFSGRKISVLQHILLGMNAHINLDLGLAAAHVSKNNDIRLMKNDFMLVNQILTQLIDEIQRRISRVSPLMFLLDWAGGRQDEQMISFNIAKARQQAWKVGCTLNRMSEQERQATITLVDQDIARLAYRIYRPPLPLIRLALKTISLLEEKQVGKIIEKLQKD